MYGSSVMESGIARHRTFFRRPCHFSFFLQEMIDVDAIVPPPCPQPQRMLHELVDGIALREAGVDTLSKRQTVLSFADSSAEDRRKPQPAGSAWVGTPIGKAFETFALQPTPQIDVKLVEDYAAIRSLLEYLPPNPRCKLSAKVQKTKGRAFNVPPAAGHPSHQFFFPPSDNRHWCSSPAWQGFLRLCSPQVNAPHSRWSSRSDFVGQLPLECRKFIPEVLLQSHGVSNEKSDLLLDFIELEQQRKKEENSMDELFGPTLLEEGDGSDTGTPTHSRRSSRGSRQSSRAHSEVSSRALSIHRQQQVLAHGIKNHRYLIRRGEDPWIALKGVVFRIPIEGNSIESEGRRLYYKLHLAPCYSGRDCTLAFFNMPLQYEASDFDEPLTPSRKQQQEHLDRVFDVFYRDFVIVGVLEAGEQYWH